MLSNLFLARNLTSLTYCSSPTHPTKWCPKSTTVWWSWCSWIPFLLPVSIRPSPSITVYHRPSFPMIKTWKLTKNSTAVNDLVVAIQLFRHLTQRPRLTRSKQLPHEVTPKNPTSNKFTQDLPLGKPQQWKFNSFKCNRTTWHQVFLMRQHRKRSCRWVSRKLWECSPNFRGFNSYNGRVNPTNGWPAIWGSYHCCAKWSTYSWMKSGVSWFKETIIFGVVVVTSCTPLIRFLTLLPMSTKWKNLDP